MRKCRYIYDPKAGKVWIPECWGGIYGPSGCTCIRTKKEPTESQKDKKMIRELQEEIADLYRIIKKLTNRDLKPWNSKK